MYTSPNLLQVRTLAERTESTLAALEERAVVLRARQEMWEQQSAEQEKLAAWLRDMEREKQLLHLKHVAVSRIPRVLATIQQLLDRVPQVCQPVPFDKSFTDTYRESGW